MSLNAAWLASLPHSERARLLEALPAELRARALFQWEFWARPAQLSPAGEWSTWLLLAGRGFGKTRTGSEWVRAEVESGRGRRLALVARTAADVRDVLVQGESGILAVSPPWFRPKWEPSKRRLTWPNGAVATTYSADKPDQLRGPQHDRALCDELAAWRYPEAWDQLQFGLRLGQDPRVAVATTPRPTPLIRSLLADPTTFVTRGSTFENRGHLAPKFLAAILRKYEGTRLGRQELLAEILDDNPYALWQRAGIEKTRVARAPALRRIVVAVDPSVTDGETSSETGIVAAGAGTDGRFYVLDDRSLRASPAAWALVAVTLYRELGADRLVAEVNQGGDLVELTIRTVDPAVSYRAVRATRGKLLRAEPVAALYEQERVSHVGCLPELEDQLCDWMPGLPSPDRLDALVWALTDLAGLELLAEPQVLERFW